MQVKSGPKQHYHHGDLANALTGAATDLARKGGPDAVVLREAARQVGVSATAAYRHFASHSDLIHAVKERALAGLAEAMEAELAKGTPLPDPAEDAFRRLAALGRGYVQFAVTEPGLFRTAFCNPDVPTQPDNSGLQESRPYLYLSNVLDDLAALGRIMPERREFAEVMAWSTVHGLAMLLIDGPLRSCGPAEREGLLDRTVQFVREGLAPQLSAP